MNRILFSLSLLALLACNRVEPLDTPLKRCVEPTADISISIRSSSKGEIVVNPADLGSLGLYCAQTNDLDWSYETDFDKLYNRKYSVTESGDWVVDGTAQQWGYNSVDDKYTFYAYSPYSDNSQTITSYIDSAELVLNYVVPRSSIEQPDLMYAIPCKNIVATEDGCVPLTFTHILSCISFSVISAQQTEITNIEISGVVDSGTFRWDSKTDSPTWSLGELSEDSFSVEVSDYSLDEDNSAQLNSNRGYLMMIPQQLDNEATVLVTFEGGQTKSFKIPAGTKWERAARYNYVIRLDDVSSDFLFDSSQISNCYIINPTEGKPTVVQIPIEDRINDFWMNYSGEQRDRITADTGGEDLDTDVLWDDVEPKYTIKPTFLDDDSGKMCVSFTLPAEVQEGNIVFAVLGDDGSDGLEILWSWHLWLTSYNPDAIATANKYSIIPNVDMAYTLTGCEGAVHRYSDSPDSTSAQAVWATIYKDKFIMDRNIGELSEPATGGSVGSVFYEFGRKDAFPGSEGVFTPDRLYGGTRDKSTFKFYESVEFAADYFISYSAIRNWSNEKPARNSKFLWYDKNLLSANYSVGKSIFDPSPLGWRIPLIYTWNNYDPDKSVGKYYYNGYRNPDNKGKYEDNTEIGYVWSANLASEDTAWCFYHKKNKAGTTSEKFVIYGFPIRPIQE